MSLRPRSSARLRWNRLRTRVRVAARQRRSPPRSRSSAPASAWCSPAVPSTCRPGSRRGTRRGRVDLSVYLGAGSYPGHSYQLTHRRGDAFGTGYGCPVGATRCIVEAQELADQYGFGFTDGYDLGQFDGLVAGHRDGFVAGQAATIRILDANGLVVYDGEFTPASYVREHFSDRKSIRYGGVGLLAAGALIGLFWPDSPARNLDLKPLRGGGWIGASVGF